MKKIKILLLTVFTMVSVYTVYGQVEVAVGIKGGLNFATVNTSSLNAAYNSHTGFHAGAFALFKFTKIGIQPELVYSQQGSTVKINTQNFNSNFNYLNIPILLKLYLVGGLNLQAGPQFGFLMSANGPNGVDVSGNVTTGDIKNQLKSSDISVAMGAGWDLPFGLNIDARYNLGTSDINNNASAQAAKNQVFQLSVGYKLFKFGK